MTVTDPGLSAGNQITGNHSRDCEHRNSTNVEDMTKERHKWK